MLTFKVVATLFTLFASANAVMPLVNGLFKTSMVTDAGYEIHCLGACSSPVKVTPVPSLVLMGGGTDVDDAFKFLIENANGGDFLILRASGTDAYNPYVMNLSTTFASKPLNSVTTIITTTRDGAKSWHVSQKIKSAAAVWLAGGDQHEYVQFWKGTDVEKKIQSMVGYGPLGGTSAGMAVLGEFVFDAATGGTDSEDALRNPYERDMTLVKGFLSVPLLKNTITDTHFYQRDRMGRLVTFLARIVEDDWAKSTAARGIACDEQTALLIDASGHARVATQTQYDKDEHVAYLVKPTEKPSVCKSGERLTFKDLHVVRCPHNSTVDLNSFKGITGTSEFTISADDGEMSSHPY